MTLPSIIPHLTTDSVSPSGTLNIDDIKKMVRNAIIFFVPVILLYGAQLTGALSNHMVLNMKDIVPSAFVIGAFEAHIIGTALDYLRKLNASK